MGMTHLDAYSRLPDVRVVAVADQKFATPGATVGRAGNIAGQSSGGFDLDSVKKYVEAIELINDPEVQAVDICAPTSSHKELALLAIKAGKSVFVEKPLARTSTDAREIAEAAAKAGVVLMPAHCMRFWPGWDWLKAAMNDKRFGAVQSASFVRLGSKPPTPFYNDGVASGGSHLDLHIHDTDFVLFLFGMPDAVTSFGRIGESGAVEHTVTRYHFGDTDALVTSEGAWTRDAEKRPFEMRYTVVFERATVVYNLGADPVMRVYQADKEPEAVLLSSDLGYALEVAEFARCAAARQNSPVVNGIDGYRALEIIEAELRSIETGQTFYL
jgi:predicted dehydrogenase